MHLNKYENKMDCNFLIFPLPNNIILFILFKVCQKINTYSGRRIK